MPTLFTRIIQGELPARFVWKDDTAVAFLSINPLKDGHTLVVPREEVDHWIDASPQLLDHVFRVCHAIGQGLQRAFRPTRVGLIIAGLEVPHLHTHVVPIDGPDDLNFANADGNPDEGLLDRNAERVREALRELDYDHVTE
ncbi:MAG: HIT family protein [Nitriliruptorales bacterium]